MKECQNNNQLSLDFDEKKGLSNSYLSYFSTTKTQPDNQSSNVVQFCSRKGNFESFREKVLIDVRQNMVVID